MGFSFRKSFKITSGIKVNVGKKGASVSLGGKGSSINIGTRGIFTNANIPSTGISYRSNVFIKKQRGKKTLNENSVTDNNSVIEGGIMLGVIVGGILFWLSGSFLLSFVPVILFPTILALHQDTSKESGQNKEI